MTQLARGAGQVLKDIDDLLKAILNHTDDPVIQSLIVDIRILHQDELKPMLRRRDSTEPTAEARLRAAEDRIKQLEAFQHRAEPILFSHEQDIAQHL
jgi:hypothetical protein